jgi:hypothetical protein
MLRRKKRSCSTTDLCRAVGVGFPGETGRPALLPSSYGTLMHSVRFILAVRFIRDDEELIERDFTR